MRRTLRNEKGGFHRPFRWIFSRKRSKYGENNPKKYRDRMQEGRIEDVVPAYTYVCQLIKRKAKVTYL